MAETSVSATTSVRASATMRFSTATLPRLAPRSRTQASSPAQAGEASAARASATVSSVQPSQATTTRSFSRG